MKRILDYHSLIPIIRINSATLAKIQRVAKARKPRDKSVGLISGVPEFTGPTPMITFSKFEMLVTSDQVPSLNVGEVSVYLLFQESRPIDNLEEFGKDYITSNQALGHYSSNYCYHIFCTDFYSEHVELNLHMVTPNVILTMEETNAGIESRADTKRSRSCATYTLPRVVGGCVETAYWGVTGVEDPRILAVSYSIALNYGDVPIVGLIQRRSTRSKPRSRGISTITKVSL
jgi:hypothetical protein